MEPGLCAHQASALLTATVGSSSVFSLFRSFLHIQPLQGTAPCCSVAVTCSRPFHPHSVKSSKREPAKPCKVLRAFTEPRAGEPGDTHALGLCVTRCDVQHGGERLLCSQCRPPLHSHGQCLLGSCVYLELCSALRAKAGQFCYQGTVIGGWWTALGLCEPHPQDSWIGLEVNGQGMSHPSLGISPSLLVSFLSSTFPGSESPR